jgi:predicted deacylase
MPKSAVASNGKASRSRAVLDPRSPTFSREFRKAAKAFTKRATASPEAALAVLVKEGILTKSGKLSKNYR